MKALVPFAQGFEETEAITVIDLLRRSGISVVTASISTDPVVVGAHSIPVRADLLLSDVRDLKFDLIALPGGMPGTQHLGDNEMLLEMLKTHAKRKAWIGAICAAPSVLGKAGLLDGRNATCYPGFEAKLGRAKFLDEPVVVDEKIVTSRGVGTAIPFALKLIECLVGKERSQAVQESILAKLN